MHALQHVGGVMVGIAEHVATLAYRIEHERGALRGLVAGDTLATKEFMLRGVQRLCGAEESDHGKP